MSIAIAFIGFGEAGSHIARGLFESGQTDLTTWDSLMQDAQSAQQIVDRARAVGINTATSGADAVHNVQAIFSLVTADQCEVAARDYAEHLTEGQFWFDMNSTSGVAKQAASRWVEAQGAHYIDSAVMDNVPALQHQVPLLLAGTQATAGAQLLTAVGMTARVVGNTVGDAATIKMCRSVFLKGFEATLIESMAAAAKAGVLPQVVESIDKTFPHLNLPETALGRLTRSCQHSKRRASEMRAATATLESIDVKPITALATSLRLQSLADSAVFEQIRDEDTLTQVCERLAAIDTNSG